MPGYKAFRERWVIEATKDMYMIMQICLQMQPTNNARARKEKKGDTTGHKCKKRFRNATCYLQ